MRGNKAGASRQVLGNEESAFELDDGDLKSAILLTTDLDYHWKSSLQGRPKWWISHFDVAPSTETTFTIGLGHSSEETTS